MTSKKRSPKQELAWRARARRNLIDFCSYIDPKAAKQYQSPHLQYIAEHLEAVERGEITRLMIFMPNRHWKSSLVSQKFVSWFIGKRQQAKEPHGVMLISHTREKSEEFSAYTRNLIRDDDPLYKAVFPETQISPTRQSASRWGLLDQNGMEEMWPTMVTGSMNAPPTGSGANVLIIDDPVKNSQEARSQATQRLHLKNFDEGLRTRLNDPKRDAIILMMTRWYVGDIAGQLLKRMHDDPLADQWTVICLPALAYTSKEAEMARRIGIPVSDECPIGRQPSEPLWPEKFGKRHHLQTRANSPTAFASIGQQLPIPETGHLLSRDDFKYMEAPPRERVRWCIPVDAAYKEKELAKDDPDFNVVGLLGFWLPEGNLYNAQVILGMLVRTQMGLTAMKEIIPKFADACQNLVGGKMPIIGDVATLDRILFDDLRGNPAMMGWSIRSLADRQLKRKAGSFTGDKVSKFEPWRDRAEGGRFHIVDEAWSAYALRQAFGNDLPRLFGDEPLAWQEKFFTEVEGFPNWHHDDMVDMVSAGYHYLAQGGTQVKKKAGSYQG